MSLTQKQRVISYIENALQEGPFYPNEYLKNKPNTISLEGKKISLSTLSLNEISASFSSDANYGRTAAQLKTSWEIEATIGFTKEIDSSFFEKAFTSKSHYLPTTSDFKAVKITLQRVTYRHPPKQMPENGSTIIYSFSVAEQRN